MPADPYYRSPAWRALRKAALERDGYRCTTPGCGGTKRLTVDHIVSRRAGGADALPNLTTRCIDCDNQVKEGADGARRGGATPMARGCDADGSPRDPGHPWLRPKPAPTPGGGPKSETDGGLNRPGVDFSQAPKIDGGVSHPAPALTVLAGPGADIEEPDWAFLIPPREDGRHEPMRAMAHREWRRVTAELRDSQTLAPANRHSVQRLVLAYVRYDLAAAMVMAEGAVVQAKRTKVPMLNIWQTEMRAADSDATSQEMELCLNPRRRAAAGKAIKKAKRATAADSYLGATGTR